MAPATHSPAPTSRSRTNTDLSSLATTATAPSTCASASTELRSLMSAYATTYAPQLRHDSAHLSKKRRAVAHYYALALTQRRSLTYLSRVIARRLASLHAAMESGSDGDGGPDEEEEACARPRSGRGLSLRGVDTCPDARDARRADIVTSSSARLFDAPSKPPRHLLARLHASLVSPLPPSATPSPSPSPKRGCSGRYRDESASVNYHRLLHMQAAAIANTQLVFRNLRWHRLQDNLMRASTLPVVSFGTDRGSPGRGVVAYSLRLMHAAKLEEDLITHCSDQRYLIAEAASVLSRKEIAAMPALPYPLEELDDDIEHLRSQ